MFRRAIFLGLTLMLGGVVVVLVLKSRKEERKPAPPVEIVKASIPTAMRVLLPEDLDLLETGLELPHTGANNAGRRGEVTARHRIVIRNHGQVSYGTIKLEVEYVSAGGRILGKRTKVVPVTMPPGQTVTAGDIMIADAPGASARARARILYAELSGSDQPAEQDAKK